MIESPREGKSRRNSKGYEEELPEHDTALWGGKTQKKKF